MIKTKARMWSNGFQHRTAKAGAGDGVLFIDADGNGVLSNSPEIVFTEWAGGASDDLVALRKVFDTTACRQFIGVGIYPHTTLYEKKYISTHVSQGGGPNESTSKHSKNIYCTCDDVVHFSSCHDMVAKCGPEIPE